MTTIPRTETKTLVSVTFESKKRHRLPDRMCRIIGDDISVDLKISFRIRDTVTIQDNVIIEHKSCVLDIYVAERRKDKKTRKLVDKKDWSFPIKIDPLKVKEEVGKILHYAMLNFCERAGIPASEQLELTELFKKYEAFLR